MVLSLSLLSHYHFCLTFTIVQLSLFFSFHFRLSWFHSHLLHFCDACAFYIVCLSIALLLTYFHFHSQEERPQRIDSISVDIRELKAFIVSHEDRQIRTMTIPDITKNVALKEERTKRKATQPSRHALPVSFFRLWIWPHCMHCESNDYKV